ncbi:SWIM zinc finger family protein [Shewanella sp. 202IG2-18]|uniref:SWIM zinc finger family protein n=1 Tax=Parashewanella hymeniacidonis TaxID=2807618 RepID=UPI001961D7E9|nr:SWIM zinc finger family protein [Parashewanella hymeniacidonis]MBM7073940.1 SWIM zinc finger family protein [Parashewanella hymeniacidonis]
MATQKTWWGLAFIDSLTNFIDSGRLQRGRAYRTDHRILAFEINKNKIKATIRGNVNPYFGVTKEPKYKVTLSLKSIDKKRWTDIINQICQNPSWISKLMLNEIPANIEQVFTGDSFLPTSFNDVTADCSCPDYANPCKHIAGVYYRLADILDYDPMLLFQLKGLSAAELQTALKKTELGQLFAEHLDTQVYTEISTHQYKYVPLITKKTVNRSKNVALDNSLQSNHRVKAFWQMSDWPEKEVELEEQTISAPLIKKQGDYPAFWTRSNSFVAAMEEIYSNVRKKNKKVLG